MAKSGGLAAALMIGASCLFGATTASAEMQSGGAMSKLGRGVVNTFTGWVEVPKRASETAHSQGTAAGLTWGILRGFGFGFVRTAAGLYEIITFPFPAPPDYAPVIQPEFVFSDSAATSTRSY